MNYHKITAPPDTTATDDRSRIITIETIDQHTRTQWLALELTIRLLDSMQLVITKLELANESLASSSFETNKEVIHRNLIQIATLRKAVNLTQTGKYENPIQS